VQKNCKKSSKRKRFLCEKEKTSSKKPTRQFTVAALISGAITTPCLVNQFLDTVELHASNKRGQYASVSHAKVN